MHYTEDIYWQGQDLYHETRDLKPEEEVNIAFFFPAELILGQQNYWFAASVCCII